jgi:hypothetical protein
MKVTKVADRLTKGYFFMLNQYHLQARSSGGERYLDTVEVGGSKPPGPTIFSFLFNYFPGSFFSRGQFGDKIRETRPLVSAFFCHDLLTFSEKIIREFYPCKLTYSVV